MNYNLRTSIISSCSRAIAAIRKVRFSFFSLQMEHKIQSNNNTTYMDKEMDPLLNFHMTLSLEKFVSVSLLIVIK